MSGSSLPAVSNGLSNNIEAITIPLGSIFSGVVTKEDSTGTMKGTVYYTK